MTEQEALTKWCPQRGRIKSPAERALSPGMCCIGSACMAWRWELTEHGKRELSFGRLDTTKKHDGAMLAGFCGLAGQP